MIALRIAGVTLRRWLRDRTALFFMVVLPVVVIVVVGSTMSSEADSFRVGVLDQAGGPVSTAVLDAMRSSPQLDVRSFDDEESLQRAVRRSELAAGVVLPSELEATAGPEPRPVRILFEPASPTGMAAEQAVRSVVAERSAVLAAAAFAADELGGLPADHLAAAVEASEAVPPLRATTTVGGESSFLPVGFTYSAATMLVLFVFINSVGTGAAIVENRRAGLYARMLAAPVAPRSIVAGEALTYLVLALVQSAIIVGIGAALFEVEWGDPLAALLLVGAWAAVGAAAGVLAGTVLRTAEQASSIGPMVGIALGMLGGCMWPLEIVPPVMQAIGRLVPHAWAVDAWVELLSRDGGVAQIAGPLAVLTGFAVVLGTVAATRLHRQLAA